MVSTVGSYNRKNYGLCTNWARWTAVGPFPIATSELGHGYSPSCTLSVLTIFSQWRAADSHMSTGPSWCPRPVVVQEH